MKINFEKIASIYMIAEELVDNVQGYTLIQHIKKIRLIQWFSDINLPELEDEEDWFDKYFEFIMIPEDNKKSIWTIFENSKRGKYLISLLNEDIRIYLQQKRDENTLENRIIKLIDKFEPMLEEGIKNMNPEKVMGALKNLTPQQMDLAKSFLGQQNKANMEKGLKAVKK